MLTEVHQFLMLLWHGRGIDDQTGVGIQEAGGYLLDIFLIVYLCSFLLQMQGKGRGCLVITTHGHVPMQEETGDGTHANASDADKIYRLDIF